MYGVVSLRNTRNNESQWRSTEDGWIALSPSGSMTMRPDASSSRMERSERITGGDYRGTMPGGSARHEETVVTDASASAPIPEQVHDILTDLPTGFVATLRPDGMLSVTPVGLMFDGDVVRFSTTKDRKKYRNLQRDDRIAIAVPHRNNPNRYVEVRGRAQLDDDDDHAFIDSVAQHYMGVDRYPFDRPGQVRVTVTIVAQHVSTPEIPLADNPPQARDR